MKHVLTALLASAFVCSVAGCGDDKQSKPASGGGGSTTPATIKPPPKGERPKME